MSKLFVYYSFATTKTDKESHIMGKVVRGHQNTFHPDHKRWFLKLKDNADVQAAQEISASKCAGISGVTIVEQKFGPFVSPQKGDVIANLLNKRASQIRSYRFDGRILPTIESFLASQEV